MSYINEKECFIETHFADNVDFKQQCNGNTVTYFEDFTHNHNKTLIYFEAVAIPYAGGSCGGGIFSNGTPTPTSPFKATIIIETRDGKTIKRPIQFVSLIPGLFYGVATFQAENVCRVSLKCDSSGIGSTLLCGFFDFVKTFCLCCSDGKSNNRD